MRSRTPCFNCPDRVPGCHGQCEKYLQWKRDIGSFTEDEKRARKQDRLEMTVTKQRQYNKALRRRT
jgi:hypothetical protein